MIILGISDSHEAHACIVQDGRLSLHTKMGQSSCKNFMKMDTFWTPAIKKDLEQSPKSL